jgi:hypothetical protein
MMKKKIVKSDKKTTKKPYGKVDKSTALTLKLTNNLSYRKIGKLQGTTGSAVHKSIKDLVPPPEIKKFRERRADLLAFTQAKDLLTYLSLNEKERKKLIMKRGLIDTGISFDKERLERGYRNDNSILFRIVEEACNSRKVTEIAVNVPGLGDGLIESQAINK